MAGIRFTTTTARDVALAMLAWRFGPTRHDSPARRSIATHAARARLLPFQAEAVHRLAGILERWHGAVLADSVGLGKTHVARVLIRAALEAGRPVLVTGPAQLAGHWRGHLRGVTGWTWLSHTSLSRGVSWRAGGPGRPALPAPAAPAAPSAPPTRPPRPAQSPLIVVDEAHAFRNPAARRYRHLSLLCTDADVLLMTASPVNNSAFDFYHLLRLFAADDAFALLGVPDLLGAFESLVGGGPGEQVRRVAESVVVRRTRDIVRQRAGTRGGSFPATFPRSGPAREVRYDTASGAGERRRLLELIRLLRFPVHRLHGVLHGGELLRLSLLKRLDSSVAALLASVERLTALTDHFCDAATRGFLFDISDRRIFGAPEAGARQLLLEQVALRPWPARLDRSAALDAARAERALLAELHDLLAAAHDDKAARLLTLLRTTLAEERVLVFTEFRDTADALWRTLAPAGGIGLVHGNDARLGRGRASRGAVIRRFAPRANGVREPAPHERVRVLIATDVLAEGMNLQDARVVISYDMPWNPVRLAQRIGRIDRLGSPHRDVLSFVFTPDTGLDELLGLMRRVRRKLRHIRLVGGDAPRLGTRSGSGVAPRRVARDAMPPDTSELLRGAFLRHAGSHRHARAAGCLLAATAWDGAERAAVCCVTAGETARLVLVPDGRVDPAAIDRALLDALDGAGRPPDPQFAAHAARNAIAAVRRRFEAVAPVAVRGAERWAARTVHRWLASRPGGASPAECATADNLLERLTPGLPLGAQRAIADLARRGLPPDRVVAELRTVLSTLPAATVRPEATGVRVRAVLELVPVPAPSATGPQGSRRRRRRVDAPPTAV